MDTNIDTLKKENERLQRQLENAQKWMQAEIDESKDVIQKKHDFTSEIEEKIYRFFSPEVLSYFPSDGVENIISSEYIYKHLWEWDQIDGTGVIMWYQKILDSMVELYITKWYRKHVLKHSKDIPHINTPLEKSLAMVCNKKHILSLWRLYGILEEIQENKKLWPYTNLFHEYIKSRPFLQKALLESDFFLQLKKLIHLHVLTEKRHSGTLSYHDTTLARNICNWNFEDTNCILYILASTKSTI